MNSWKTTTTGLIAVLTALGAAVNALIDGNPASNPDWAVTMPAILAGLGLMFARDNKVTSEQAGATYNPKEIRLLLLVGGLAAWSVTQPASAAVYLAPTNPPGAASLIWDPSPDPTVTSYYIYYGVAPRTYTNRVTVGNVTTATIKPLSRGTLYYFAATATDGELESDWSNEVSYRPKPIPIGPGNLKTNDVVVRASIETAPHPKGPWTFLADVWTTTEAPGYFRSKLSIESERNWDARTWTNGVTYAGGNQVASSERRRKPPLPPIPGQ